MTERIQASFSKSDSRIELMRVNESMHSTIDLI